MMYRAAITLGLAAALAGCAASHRARGDLYSRVDARLSADPALGAAIGKPAAEMADVAWLVGDWEVTSAIEGSADAPDKGTSKVTQLFGGVWLELRDSYPKGVQDVSYLGYDPATRQWTSIGLDSYGNANIVHAPGWRDGRLTFEGQIVVLGLKTHLRQVMIRQGPDAYRVENYELLAGKWHLMDWYQYRRL